MGEGFGIVLTEAALAGLTVVAPANDGSRDAILPGITGLRPADQSMDALATTLRWIANHRTESELIGRNARVWANRAFDPNAYPPKVSSLLWGRGINDDWLGLMLNAVPHETRP
jgi:glycosyltransferase involved in cell wall biosynthesis